MDTHRTFARQLNQQGGDCRRVARERLCDTVERLIDGQTVGTAAGFEQYETLLAQTDVKLRPTVSEVRDSDTGVTVATAGVAETGSVLHSMDTHGSGPISTYPNTHVVLLPESRLLASLSEAIERYPELLESTSDGIVLATGPSASGDLGASVEGIQGPENVIVIVIEDTDE